MINGVLAVVVWFVTLLVAVPFGMWAIWPTAEKHGYRRGYTEGHKRADREQPALPKAGRLEPLPELAPIPWQQPREAFTPWVFAGGWDQGPVSESAEYELLTQTAEQPVSVTGEPPIDTGELMAITDRVESWIAGWAAQGNYDRHTMRAD